MTDFTKRRLWQDGDGPNGALYNGGTVNGAITMSSLTPNTSLQLDSSNNIISGPIVPKIYKALISQNTPILTTSSPSMIAGQIWELTTWLNPDAGDLAGLATLELVSGVLAQNGSKYRSSIDQNFGFKATNELKYDGAPYVVSTDANGDFAPFVNTIGNIVWSYFGVGDYMGTLNGMFLVDKMGLIANQFFNTPADFSRLDDNRVRIQTYTIDNAPFAQTQADNNLSYRLITIEVYP